MGKGWAGGEWCGVWGRDRRWAPPGAGCGVRRGMDRGRGRGHM